MLNLYEILEVSEKASKEVIEKAYHVLAKKYHPDLQQEVQKQEAEKKMKQINEAYEILSDEEKRKEYDIRLEQERQTQKQQELQKLQRQKEESKSQVEKPIVENELHKEDIRQQTETMKQQNTSNQNIQNFQNEMKKAYRQAYYDYLRSLRL